jgi:endosialidase-like protein
MSRSHVSRTLLLFLLLPVTVIAQVQRDAVPLKPWPAPLYWQPTAAENQIVAKTATFGNEVAEDTRPANSVVFVGMTPCRVADTRNGSGFTGSFGPPSLVGGAKRTFPIQSSPNCSIPSIAQAYSFNITIVPPGFVDFVTVGPTPVATPPTFSTLNGYVCAFSSSPCVISNAAIVPAGTSGSVDVYASQSTNLLIDINGYYAAQSGITLAQGTAATPSLSFSGDAGTGIFSAGAGTLNLATGGTNRLSVAANGDVTAGGLLSANIVNAATQFNLGGNRILSTPGTNNLFVGSGSGAANPTGINNAFFGAFTGNVTTTGFHNAFFGQGAALNNTTGYYNSFFGSGTGQGNTEGVQNSLFGTGAGIKNVTGISNSFFGAFAGANTTSNENSFVGALSGNLNTTGAHNSFLGEEAGYYNTAQWNNTFLGWRAGYNNGNNDPNTTAGQNTFIGTQTGGTNHTGGEVSLLGYEANVGTDGLSNATAIGANAVVSQNNSLVLGSIAGLNGASADTFVGIGTPTPGVRLHMKGAESRVRLETTLSSGYSTTEYVTDGRVWHTGVGGSTVANGVAGKYYIADLNTSQFRMVIDTDGHVGVGTTTPDAALTVNGTADKPGGGSWAVFSDERLKNITGQFTTGLEAVMKLQPIRYGYKPENALGLPSGGEHVGFSAQAVREVIPEAVTENEKGYLLINNDPIIWTVLNAVKEQQTEIGDQQRRINELEEQKLQQQEQNRKLEERLAALESLLSTKLQARANQ